MKLNRIVAILLCLTLLMSFMVACTSDSPDEDVDSGTTFTPGTYTATADGHNGDVVVEVVFSEKAIVSVTVKEHEESAGIADAPIETIPSDIVEGQTLALDTVSGATVTSEAILAAVEDCVVQAGGDVSILKAGKADEDGDKTETEMTTDIVVVGAGGTGLAAAAAANENGASVIVLEKLAITGGSTAMSGGGISATGTRFQEEIDVEDTKQSWMDLWKERQATSNPDGPYPDYDRVDEFMDAAIVTTHWLVDNIKHTFEVVAGYGFDPVKRIHFPEGWSGRSLTDNIETHLEDKETEILMETEATELILDDNGDVVGVMAENKDGIIKINAKKVILASGGFAKSEELLERFVPEMAGTAEMSAATVGSTGDGILMAEEVGAGLYEDPWVIGLGSSSIVPELKILDWDTVNIMVNQEGNRFFAEAVHYAIVTNEVAAQETVWKIVDSKEANAETVEVLEAVVDGKEVVKAETIEELAEAMDVPVDSLVDTIESFNKGVESGQDEFGKQADMLSPVNVGPYYAFKTYPKTMGTFGGVKTDELFRVLREDGSIINNLYAGGECSNKVYYNQVYMTGSAVQVALTSGRIAGEHAAQSIK